MLSVHWQYSHTDFPFLQYPANVSSLTVTSLHTTRVNFISISCTTATLICYSPKSITPFTYLVSHWLISVILTTAEFHHFLSRSVPSIRSFQCWKVLTRLLGIGGCSPTKSWTIFQTSLSFAKFMCFSLIKFVCTMILSVTLFVLTWWFINLFTVLLFILYFWQQFQCSVSHQQFSLNFWFGTCNSPPYH